jgi:hypothetical protein
MPVFEKLATIMEELDHVGLDKGIKKRNSEEILYMVRTEPKVVAALRPLFVKYKLVMTCEDITHIQQTGKITVLAAKWRITDSTDGTYCFMCAPGAGYDEADKGPGKAFTYSDKYALLKSLMLTGAEEDPDLTSTGDIVAKEEEYAGKIREMNAELRRMLEAGKITPDQKKATEEWLADRPPARAVDEAIMKARAK